MKCRKMPRIYMNLYDEELLSNLYLRTMGALDVFNQKHYDKFASFGFSLDASCRVSSLAAPSLQP